MHSVYSVIAAASNIKGGEHPPFSRAEFLALYPQFSDVPELMIDAWLRIAMHSLAYNRWQDYWEVGVGLFVAHHLTLLSQPGMQERIESGLMKGIPTSKSVTDMSISYDFGSIENEFAGWGTYAQTVYGQQLVQFARLVGKGGMTIW